MATLEQKQNAELLSYDPMVFIKAADLAAKMPFTAPGRYIIDHFDPHYLDVVTPMCLLGVIAYAQGTLNMAERAPTSDFWNSPEYEHTLSSIRKVCGHYSATYFFDNFHGRDTPMTPRDLRDTLLCLAGNKPLPEAPNDYDEPAGYDEP